MKLKFFNCFLFILLISCSDNPRQNIAAQNKIENKNETKNKPAATFTDTLKINFSAAVFYYPDSLQLEKIRSITDAGVFEGSMHEYENLMRNAHLVIKRDMPNLKIIEAKKARYILFIRADKKRDCLDLDTKIDPYGLFLFNRQKPGELVDMANIESELGFYFSK